MPPITLEARVEALEAKAEDFEARLQTLETKTDELIEAVRHWGEALLQTNPESKNDSY